MLGTVLGAVLFILGLHGNNRVVRQLLLGLVVLYYLLFLIVSMIEAGVFDFTGQGFNEEFFFHFEAQAIKVALEEYFWAVILVSLGLLLIIGILFSLAKSINYNSSFLLMFLGLFCMTVAAPYSSLGNLFASWQKYQHNEFKNFELKNFDRKNIKHFQSLNIINAHQPSSLFNFKASASGNSKNLILVYLESFNYGFLNHPKYPELTPRINQLTKEMTSIEMLSSSYVTIEGIIASQCGIMLPMGAGNNTFLKSGQLMNYMPCLGDVLKKTGYHQYYLGGTVMEFAGKGNFLTSHGYDVIRGWQFWHGQKGYTHQKGVWGLSDASLFKEAINTIKEAAKKPPYNVTLLTLGTHIPGYSYQGCQNYQDGKEPFLNAVHCTDHLLGGFVDALKQQKLLDHTVLMIVADHGVFNNKEMKRLFGEMVKDRKLLALVNQPLPFEQMPPFAGYDIAPTLLDLLHIKHDVTFLYGRSLFSKDKKKQKHVTRYNDWKNEQLVGNQPGSCEEQPSWPLNKCHKKELINYTNQVIAKFSHTEPKEQLPCDLTLSLQHAQEQTALLLDNKNHFSHFYYKGYRLDPQKIKTGIWGFSISEHNEIIDHIYFKKDLPEIPRFKKYINKIENRHVWIVRSDSPEFLQKIGAKPTPEVQLMQMDKNHNVTWVTENQFNICQPLK